MSPLPRSRAWALLLFSVFPSATIQATCYFPDGSAALDYTWVPCYTPTAFSTPHSPCCIPSEGDICQTNGLCYYPPNGNLFRGACTDPTFQDPACPQQCMTGGGLESWVWVDKCEGGNDSWACGGLLNGGHQLAACWSEDNGFKPETVSTSLEAPTRTAAPTTTTNSAEMTVVGEATSTTTDESTPSVIVSGTGNPVETGTTASAPANTGVASTVTKDSASPKLGTGAIVGIAVGGLVVLAAAAAGLWFCLRAKKGSAPSRQQQPTVVVQGGGGPAVESGMSNPGVFYAATGFGGAEKGGLVPPGVVEVGGQTQVPAGMAAAYQAQQGVSPQQSYQSQAQSPYSESSSPLMAYQQPQGYGGAPSYVQQQYVNTVSELHSPVYAPYNGVGAASELHSQGYVPQQQQQYASPVSELHSPEYVPQATGGQASELRSPGYVHQPGQGHVVELDGGMVRR